MSRMIPFWWIVLWMLILTGCGAFANQSQYPTQQILPINTPPASQPMTMTTIVVTSTQTMTKTAIAPTPTKTPAPTDVFFNPQRLSYEPDFYVPQIQRFLTSYSGPLKNQSFWIGNRTHSFAEILVKTSVLYSLNPKILLTLFEQQGTLLTTAEPTTKQLDYAMGFDKQPGLYNQFRLAAIELRLALRDYATQPTALPALVFADDSQQAVPTDISLSRYVLSRMLAKTTTPDQLGAKLTTFHQTYTTLFGDPRQPLATLPPPAKPFLVWPGERPIHVTSFFDHDTPFLKENGSLVSYWSTKSEYLSYDSHPGWDYGFLPSDPVLAAGDGTVVFAGNSDDGCATVAHAVIIDHANGYRTLYWHLSSISVETGQGISRGTPIGMAGDSGCSDGPHLHFQVQYLGRDVDPYGWCSPLSDPWAINPAGQVSVWLWADMPSPCQKPPSDTVVVDNDSARFVKPSSWSSVPIGYATSAVYTPSLRGAFDREAWQIGTLDTPDVVIWNPNTPLSGRYRVLAYIPYALNGLHDSQSVHYRVRHAGGDSEVVINNQECANTWAYLGTYDFVPSEQPLVSLSTLSGDEGNTIWVDAVVWIPERANPN